jgi:ENTS family enterobactin (siderophore) exporter
MVRVPRLLADITPLRVSVPYRRMWLGAFLSGIGTHLTTTAVGLQVYEITGSTFSVGLVGVFALVPLVAMGLYGGSVVDAHDRRTVVIFSTTGIFLVALALTAQAGLGLEDVWVMYGLVALQNGLFGLNQPARSTIMPRLLGKELMPAANALGSLTMGTGLMVGPLLAALLIDWFGYTAAYGVEAALLVVTLFLLLGLPSVPPEGEVSRPGLRSVAEGLRYLGTRPNVRMTFLVDLAAMILGMPRVLFPAIGTAFLGGGAQTVGVLSAGMAVGIVGAGLLSGPLGHVRHQGRAVIWAIVAWGLSVSAFGLVVAASPGPTADGSAHWALWPAAACLALAGASDAVSSVFRNTILQTATPDSMRGRLQGVFIVVVAGGPRIGDVVLGSVGDLAGEDLAAIGGGIGVVVVVVLLALAQPRFWAYDARDPQP